MLQPLAPRASVGARPSDQFGLRASEIRLRASQIGLRLICRCLARKPIPVARKPIWLAIERNPLARKPIRLAIDMPVPRAQAKSACAQATERGVPANLACAQGSGPGCGGFPVESRKPRKAGQDPPFGHEVPPLDRRSERRARLDPPSRHQCCKPWSPVFSGWGRLPTIHRTAAAPTLHKSDRCAWS